MTWAKLFSTAGYLAGKVARGEVLDLGQMLHLSDLLTAAAEQVERMERQPQPFADKKGEP